MKKEVKETREINVIVSDYPHGTRVVVEIENLHSPYGNFTAKLNMPLADKSKSLEAIIAEAKEKTVQYIKYLNSQKSLFVNGQDLDF